MFSLPVIVFVILAAMTLVSAVLVITRHNPVHSVMWLIVTLFSVGGIYLILQAEFLFAVQIILYVGAVMVLFLFVVMLVSVDISLNQAQFSRQWPLGVLTVLLLIGELAYGFYQQSRRGFNLASPGLIPMTGGNTQNVGLALYRTYMLPVEIASLLLLVAMVGAVIMAKRKLE